MEEPETKEPVKSESACTSTGDRAGAGSPTPECSICLGHLINTSFTDSCLHQFCFTCLLQWSKIKTECPLCKQTFKSIIHNVRSEVDYDQYHVPRELGPPPPISPLAEINLDLDFEFIRHVQDPMVRRFAYRTTMTPNRQRYRLLPNPSHQPGIAESLPTVSREELRYRRRNPSDYRRTVYRHGVWSAPLPGLYARALERSAEFFRQNPYELNRLMPWINRDLQILLNGNVAHIAYVLRTIMENLTRHDLRSAELRDVLRPYFGIHTDHFLHELMNYARTGVDIGAYDSYITYPTQGLPSGYLNSVQSPASSSSSSSLSDDSDVRIVDHVGMPGDLPAVGPHALDMPGPSTVSQTFQLRLSQIPLPVLTISSNSSESECEVVGYIKPRHERTPEIIEIVSSDAEAPGPSTSAPVEEPPPRSPSFTPPPLDEPSTSQDLVRRNPRGARRNASMSFANLSLGCTLSDLSDTDSGSSTDWSKRNRRRRTRKTSRTCRKSSKKSSQKKDSGSAKKRSRKTSSSNDNDSHYEMKKRRSVRKVTACRMRTASSFSSDEEGEAPRVEKKGLVIKIRNDLVSQNDHCNESSSSSPSSSSSSFSDSDSSRNASDSNLPLKKRRAGRSRRKADSTDKSKRSKGKLKSIVKCPPVDSTVLRKDATKKEWYIDKKTAKNRSRSRSNDESERYDTRLRISLSEYRERRVAKLNPGDAAVVNEEESKRSNSQSSSRSEKIPADHHKTRHRGKHRRDRDNDQPGTSTDKHSDAKSTRKRHKSHKKHKKSKVKHSKGKVKRDKRHWSTSSSSLSSV